MIGIGWAYLYAEIKSHGALTVFDGLIMFLPFVIIIALLRLRMPMRHPVGNEDSKAWGEETGTFSAEQHQHSGIQSYADFAASKGALRTLPASNSSDSSQADRTPPKASRSQMD